MKIIIPVWQVSVDESHPVPSNKFSGVLIFVVDASRLIKEHYQRDPFREDRICMDYR